MRDIKLTETKFEDFKTNEELLDQYKEYLQDELGYSGWEVEMAASDLVNPYTAPYIVQEYDDNYDIDGIDYEVRYCHTDFRRCGLFHLADKKPFEFIMCIDTTTLEDKTVGSYSAAKKYYLF